MRPSSLLLCLFLCLSLGGCALFGKEKEDAPLPGERLSVMQLQKSLEIDPNNKPPAPIDLPAQWANAFWPQAGGYPNHAMQHLELPDKDLSRAWDASIGTGANDRFPLTAAPIVIDGRVVTLDTKNTVKAFSLASGEHAWSTDVSSQFEEERVIAGGLSYGDGHVFVTNGYNEVLALNLKSGEIVWRKSIPAPSRAAPTIVNGRVFVTTLDNRLLALSAKDGSNLWEYSGLGEMAALIGAASPAAGRDIVVPVFSSGEISALRVENGAVAWNDNLSMRQRYGGLGSLSDIKAMPVLDNGQIFAISFGGRLVAIDQRTGTRQWQRDISGSNTPWVVGNTVYVLSSENELSALNRTNGSIYWVRQLASYADPEKRKNPMTWHGPVLAGGRLMIAASNGMVLEANPLDGSSVRYWQAKHTITKPPVIADKMMILLSDDGRLYAYK